VRLAIPRSPLARSSWALIATTALNALLGLAYWALAARLYDAEVVGAGAGAISAMMFVTSIGWLGLQFLLIRFVPVAGPRAAGLIRDTYVVAGVAGLVFGGVFLAAFAGLAGLGYLAAGPLAIAVFLAGGLVWVVFSLQDPALIGLRRSFWVPVENAGFGALKAVLLVVAAGSGSAWAIFGSWVAAAAVFAVAVNFLMFRRLLGPARATTSADGLPDSRGLRRFAAGQHGIAVVAAVPDTLVPLMVLGFLGPSSNAHYYAAWSIGFSLRLLAVNISSALLSEAARAEHDLQPLVRSAARLAAGVLLPLSLIALLGAEVIMSVFGPGYEEGVGLLRIFAVSLLPFGLVTGILTIERVRQRNGLGLLVAGVATGVTIAADAILIPRLGVHGAGWGWLIGQMLAALIGLLVLMRQGTGRIPDREPSPSELQ
jgi:O-antigen/teichoic acid export membrane protein